jgi:hypothetical protein
MPDTIKVGTNRIANNAVTANTIATGAVTNEKLKEPNALEDLFLMLIRKENAKKLYNFRTKKSISKCTDNTVSSA